MRLRAWLMGGNIAGLALAVFRIADGHTDTLTILWLIVMIIGSFFATRAYDQELDRRNRERDGDDPTP